MSCLALIALVAAGGPPGALDAQVPDSARLRLRVLADAAPVARARVSVGTVSALTDLAGTVVLRLAPGTHRVVIAKLGFRADTGIHTLPPGADTSVVIRLARAEGMLESIVVSATRSDRRVEDTPLRVEVLAREEVEEKMLMTPGDITMMLNETGGLRVQTTSPSLGGANVRVQGMRGRYTLMLTDGLPLHGGQAGALGLLQIPPMDLARVEVVKGVASALYGSSAMGGVINLVSRRPAAEAETDLLLNATTRAGADGILWSSGPLSERVGYTLLAGLHQQPAVDLDDDEWTDIAGYGRLAVRPRIFWTGEQGRNVMATVGATLEGRTGGGRTPALSVVPEEMRTRRFDAGTVGRFPVGAGVFTLRGSSTVQQHRHYFSALERDHHLTGFAEASLATMRGRAATVIGAAYQLERYRGTDVGVFDFTFHVPAAFAQYELDVNERVALSASARGDVHSEYGLLATPRLSLLYRLRGGWVARLSGGTGAFAPTPFTEQTEATGLSSLRPLGDLVVERATSGSVDLSGAAGPLEISAALFASRITDALQVRVPADDLSALELFNASRPGVNAGADAMVRLRTGDLTTTASYTFVRALEPDPQASVSMAPLRDVPLTPRHSAGLVAVWEREGRGRVGVEYYFTGRQSLDENPYRSMGAPYSVVGAIGEWRVGRSRLFLNLENLGDTRLTGFHPLVRPSAGPGGRWTVDAWAPLEGRVINGGVRMALGASEHER